jgi:hypothetical protein
MHATRVRPVNAAFLEVFVFGFLPFVVKERMSLPAMPMKSASYRTFCRVD